MARSNDDDEGAEEEGEEDEAAAAERKTAKAAAERAAAVDEEKVRYAHTTVCRYLAAPTGSGAPSAAECSLAGWAPTGCVATFGGKAVYSIDGLRVDTRALVAVAGGDGMLAIYDGTALRTPGALEPLMARKACPGWIGDVQFTSRQLEGQIRLVTCDNKNM